MTEKLRFEGSDVRSTALAVTGRVENAAAQPVGALHIGDEVYLFCTGVVTKVTHAEDDGGVTRIHTVKIGEALGLDDGEAAILIAETRKRTQAALDELLGRSPLPFADDETGEIGE